MTLGRERETHVSLLGTKTSTAAGSDHPSAGPATIQGVQAKRGTSSPLHHAAATGNLQMLQNCLASTPPATINSGDQRRFTPFHVACAAGHAACVKALLQAGCDTNLLNDLYRNGWELAADLRRNEVLALRPASAPLAAPAVPAVVARSEKILDDHQKTRRSQKKSIKGNGDSKGKTRGDRLPSTQNLSGLEESNQLKSDLKSLGLSTKGSKAELRARLAVAQRAGNVRSPVTL
jgi:hypothetical protein